MRAIPDSPSYRSLCAPSLFLRLPRFPAYTLAVSWANSTLVTRGREYTVGWTTDIAPAVNVSVELRPLGCGTASAQCIGACSLSSTRSVLPLLVNVKSTAFAQRLSFAGAYEGSYAVSLSVDSGLRMGGASLPAVQAPFSVYVTWDSLIVVSSFCRCRTPEAIVSLGFMLLPLAPPATYSSHFCSHHIPRFRLRAQHLTLIFPLCVIYRR